jgi:hypothetical protein
MTGSEAATKPIPIVVAVIAEAFIKPLLSLNTMFEL